MKNRTSRRSGSASSLFSPCSKAALAMLLGAGFLAGNTQAFSQEAGAKEQAVIEEIVVTSRKREEHLQEVPLSITAFSMRDIENRSMNNLMDIANYAPNMEFTTNASGGASAGQIFIRGVGQSDFLITTDPGVGLYVDGVYLARTSGAILDLLDVNRIEILRGPQGTLYGKNTIGGAINVLTAKPGDEFATKAQITTGRFDRIDGKLSVNIPLVEGKLAMRIAGATRNRHGFGQRLDFLTGDRIGRMGNQNSRSGRALIDWTPIAHLEVLLSIDGTRERKAMSSRTVIAVNNQAPLLGLFNAVVGPYDDRFVSGDPFTSFATGSNTIKLDVWGTSLTLNWDVGALTLKSITAYRELKSTFGSDPDGSPQVLLDEFDTTNQNQFSQELQFLGSSFDNRLDWVMGLYFFKEDATAILNLQVAPGIFQAFEAFPGPVFPLGPGIACPPAGPGPCAGGLGNPLNAFFDFGLKDSNQIATKSYAAFGQGTYALSEKLSFTVGLRYTHEEKDDRIRLFHPITGGDVVPTTDVSANWDAFSPRFGVEYQWQDDLMTYFSAARGFKSGGFNGRPTAAVGVQSFAPEFLWTFETGLKSQWADRRLQINAAFFVNEYKDIQMTVVGALPQGGPDVRVENASRAEVKGFELETVARPTPGLDFIAGLGFIDARFTRVKPGAPVTKDSRFAETPRWSLNLAVQYAASLSSFGTLTLRTDYVYKSKVFHDVGNSGIIAQGGFGLWSTRVTFEAVGANWQIFAFGTNLTDKRYILAGVDQTMGLGFAEAQFGRPREWGLGASSRF